MKVVPLPPDALAEALRSDDPARRETAYRSMYRSSAIQGTLRSWAKLYDLKTMTTDDVLQESLILFDSIVRAGKFRGDSRPETFLLGICKNVIRDGVKKVQRVVFKESLSDADLQRLGSDEIRLEESTETELRRDSELEKAIAGLSENCREALLGYYFENQNMAQVAEKRGLANADQAKKAVHRCRERLRETIISNPYLLNLLNPRTT